MKIKGNEGIISDALTDLLHSDLPELFEKFASEISFSGEHVTINETEMTLESFYKTGDLGEPYEDSKEYQQQINQLMKNPHFYNSDRTTHFSDGTIMPKFLYFSKTIKFPKQIETVKELETFLSEKLGKKVKIDVDEED